MSEASRNIRVHGRVQGVFFRNWTAGEARRIGVSGWVRNRSDGSVELLASGAAGAVAELIDLLHDGPPAAAVERVDVHDTAEQAEGRFEKRPTV